MRTWIHRLSVAPHNFNLYNSFRGLQQNLRKLPSRGSCLTIPFLSRSKRVARTSQEFKLDRSTMSSICTGWSMVSISIEFLFRWI